MPDHEFKPEPLRESRSKNRAELSAKLILEGSIEARTGFERVVKISDKTQALPMLFALRTLSDVRNPNKSVGRFCVDLIKNQCSDPAIAGGLLALIVIHVPESLTGMRKVLIGSGLFDWAALEALLALRGLLAR